MLTQLAPLVVVLTSKKLAENKGLLFITFAIAISTVYIIDDFSSGFYGALIEHESGIMPRMRASTALMTYRDTGRIVIVDPHQSFFLEFLTVHFLSVITGLDYILSYFFAIKFTLVVLWGLLFTLSFNYFNVFAPYTLLIAAAFLNANQGYNNEVSFAPAILVAIFLFLTKSLTRGRVRKADIVSTVFMSIALVYASLRETLILMVTGIATLTLLLAQSVRENSSSSKIRVVDRPLHSPLILIVIIAFLRILDYSITYYLEAYANYFISLLKAIQEALSIGLTIRKKPLETVSAIANPVDRAIGAFAAISTISLLVIHIFASMILLFKHGVSELIYRGTLLAFLTLSAIPILQYVNNILLGEGFDFASSTVLARSFLPLVALIVFSSRRINKVQRIIYSKKSTKIILVCSFTFIVLFAPFAFINEPEVKSAYDDTLKTTSWSDTVSYCNALYHFVITYREDGGIYLDSKSNFLKLFYLLPLKYTTGSDIIDVIIPLDIYRSHLVYMGGSCLITVYSEGNLLSCLSPENLYGVR